MLTRITTYVTGLHVGSEEREEKFILFLFKNCESLRGKKSTLLTFEFLAPPVVPGTGLAQIIDLIST